MTRTKPTSFSEPLTREAVVAGAEVGHQPAGRAVERADDLLRRVGAPARCSQPGPAASALAALDRERARVARFVGDGEVVGAGAADDLHAAAAAGASVELHVGDASGGASGPQEVVRPCAPLAAVGALAAVERVAPAAAEQRVVARAAVDLVRRRLSPISVSRKAEPSRSSKSKSWSWPSPRATWARSEAQTPAPCRRRHAVAKEAMSCFPAPPAMRS